MKRLLTLFVLACVISTPAYAQLYSTKYRVPDQQWMELRSEHFRLIYPERYRNEALRSMSILEAEYADIQQLVGGSLKEFPVILNPDNDRSNGFVSSFNYRSEVELAPIRGKALNPRSGDWLESVLPHELVHALHFSVNPPALTRILGLLSPDMRRSIHGAAPAGFLEGIAVQHESHGTIQGSGRGNYPYFNNQFNILLGSEDEWSMGQLVHISDYTIPFNRHYIGGYRFTNWLQNEFGDDAFKNAVEYHYKYPFLGFGAALKSVTGEWPASLYRDFNRQSKRSDIERLSALGEETDSMAQKIHFDATCRRMQRPLWLDNDTILFYGRFCNRAPGIYTHSLTNLSTQLLQEVVLTEDSGYSLSDDRLQLVYARYHFNAVYDNALRGDLHQLDILSGRSRRVSEKQRLFSPDFDGDTLFAARTDGQRQVLVQVNPQTGEVTNEFPTDAQASVIQIAANPQQNSDIALIGKKNGVQAVWFYNIQSGRTLFQSDPDIVFENGSIFDLYWHPDGNRLLFVSDVAGSMNVYEYSTDTRNVVQLTQSLYNVFEPSYSPDGTRIAYVAQTGSEQIVHTLQLSSTMNNQLSADLWQGTPSTSRSLSRSLMDREAQPDSSSWTTDEYRTGFSWLKPRLWSPVIEKENGEYRYGVNLESVDVMSSQAYSLEATQYLNRAWYDFTYRNKKFYPGFQLELYNRPFLANFRIEQDDQQFIRTFLQQSRGAALKIPFRVRLESNSRFSSVLIEPQYFLSQLRFLDPGSTYTAYSGFGTRHTIGLRTVLSYRLRQFTRDLQPNSGWIIFTETRYGLNNTRLPITTSEFNITANLTDRRGFRGGISAFVAPLKRWNQSLRLTAQAITQTDLPVFNTSSLFAGSFNIDALGAANNVAVFDTRYTIPLTYADDGGVLLPIYLSNLYLVLFTQTLMDLDSTNLAAGSRAVYGAGLRSRFRVSNLAFDIGISVGWEPTRNRFDFYAGSF